MSPAEIRLSRTLAALNTLINRLHDENRDPELIEMVRHVESIALGEEE